MPATTTSMTLRLNDATALVELRDEVTDQWSLSATANVTGGGRTQPAGVLFEPLYFTGRAAAEDAANSLLAAAAVAAAALRDAWVDASQTAVGRETDDQAAGPYTDSGQG